MKKEKDDKIETIKTLILNNETASKKRIQEIKKEQTTEFDNKGADTARLTIIDNRLKEIENDLNYIKENERTVSDYEKDKRELFDKVPELKANKIRLKEKQNSIIEKHKNELGNMEYKCSEQKTRVKSIQSRIEEFDEDLKKFKEFKKEKVFDNVQNDFSDEVSTREILKTAVSIIEEIRQNHYAGIDTFKELQKATSVFTGNFNEDNIFRFKVKQNTDDDYLKFASNLKEFIEEDKINEFEKRVNELFADIIQKIAKDTTDLNSKRSRDRKNHQKNK